MDNNTQNNQDPNIDLLANKVIEQINTFCLDKAYIESLLVQINWAFERSVLSTKVIIDKY